MNMACLLVFFGVQLISEFDEMSQSSEDEADDDSGKETKDDEGLLQSSFFIPRYMTCVSLAAIIRKSSSHCFQLWNECGEYQMLIH